MRIETVFEDLEHTSLNPQEPGKAPLEQERDQQNTNYWPNKHPFFRVHISPCISPVIFLLVFLQFHFSLYFVVHCSAGDCSRRSVTRATAFINQETLDPSLLPSSLQRDSEEIHPAECKEIHPAECGRQKYLPSLFWRCLWTLTERPWTMGC